VTDAKYIGLDVHQATISAAVLDSTGKLVMESILETKATTILQFFQGLRGSVHVALEEGTCAAWLHDLLKPYVTKVLVCDARKLADLLRMGILSPVYHGEHGLRTLRELARSYLGVTRDLMRVMHRLKALYRGRRYDMTMNLGRSEITAPHYNAGLGDQMPSSRRGTVFLDIPFYRTGFLISGFSAQSQLMGWSAAETLNV